MAIDIEWIAGEHNIMLWQFSGHWTLDEFRRATLQSEVLEMGIDRFDLIMNTIGAKTPRFPMTEFQRALNIPVVKRDLLVLVTDDLFIISLLAVLRRMGLPNLSKERMVTVKKMPDALKQIYARRGETMLVPER